MNWDWDKLQEKRRRQPGQPPKREERDDEPHGGRSSDPGGDFNGPNLPPLGDFFNRFRQTRFPVLKAVAGLALLGWIASGIFIVDPEEMGVVLRFGKYARSVEPGPHYRLPFPIEESLTPKVHHVQRVEIGFRTVRSAREASQSGSITRPVLEEAAMLTGDENIVNVQFIVQYQIKDPVAFLFNVDLQILRSTGPDIYSESVKNAAEAAMREIIGRSKIDSALTDGKTSIQNECKTVLQDILDRYKSGIAVQAVQMQDVHPPQEVSDAFKDVASAREDKNRSKNKAQAYANEIIPQARGEAAEIINKAEAYKVTVEQRAKGETDRFLAVLAEYIKAKDITKKRLYLEAMEEILSSPGMEKIILGSDSATQVLPFLPLDRRAKGVK